MSQQGVGSEAKVKIYLFSGVHNGAVVELGIGQWLFGSDDSCDIILSGLAPRHALVYVNQTIGENPEISISPLDGTIALHDGVEIQPVGKDENPFVAKPEAATAWYIGKICCAWNYINERQDAILIDSLPQKTMNVATANGIEGETNNPHNIDRKANNGESPDLLSLPSVIQNNGISSKKLIRKIISLVLLVVLLIALSVAFTPDHRNGKSYEEIVSKALQENGIFGLTVEPHKPGVEIRGAVADDQAMVKIRDIARSMSIPVYLNVAVKDDLLKAVKSSLAIQGFHPYVSFADQDKANILSVAAYMKDADTEEIAFNNLRKELKELPPVTSRIIHAKELAPVIEEALRKAGLSSVKLTFLPGRVNFYGDISAIDTAAIQLIRKEIGSKLGIPIEGEILPTRLMKASSNKGDDIVKANSKGVGDAILGGLRITGVTMTPMRFITTSDGRRIFEGAKLPSGVILKRINTHALSLQKGDQVITYKLRGAD